MRFDIGELRFNNQIEIEGEGVAVYYTQGAYDFVDVIDPPSGEAALQFSVWYASQEYGRSQTLPAYDASAMEEAARGERKGKREARSAVKKG